MGQAEMISLSEVRARKLWAALRQQLHDRFDQWLDHLEAQLPEPETTLAQITETGWDLCQELTGGLTETLVDRREMGTRNSISSPTCQGVGRRRRGWLGCTASSGALRPHSLRSPPL
jgi:hypothetical protein